MGTVASGTTQHRRQLSVTFGLTFGYFVVEVAGGILTNSLALLADAAHMLTDVGGLGLALFASWIAQRKAPSAKTYGYYRAEILAAVANALALFLIAGYILYEAYRRFSHPPEVASLPMLLVATVGLGVNAFGIWNLRRGAGESLNLQGAFLEVVSDALGSVGVIVAGLIMLATGWYYADPIFSVLIGLFVLPRTWRLLMQAVDVLLEAAPARINMDALRRALLEVEGVAGVHDLHVWTITSGVEALTMHVVLSEGTGEEASNRVRARLAALLREQFGIDHTTIQVEPAGGAEGGVRF